MERFPMDDVVPEEPETRELLSSYSENGNTRILQDGDFKKKPHVVAMPNVEKKALANDEEEDDPISDIVGKYGPWQLKLTFLLSLCSFPCTFHIFSPTFMAASTDFWCARPPNLADAEISLWRNFSQTSDGCSIRNLNWSSIDEDSLKEHPPSVDFIKCSAWEYDRSIVGDTVISDWDLVCDNEYLRTLSESLFLLGVAVGGIVSGLISDRFGRKKALIYSLLMQTILAFSITFCPYFGLYMTMRIILGFFCVSVVFAGFVLAIELVGGNWRAVSGVCNFFPLPISYIIVSAASLVLPDWRQLQLALSIPGILLLTLWWLVPESPRWLLTMGRTAEVKEILIEGAKYNKRTVPDNIDKILGDSNNVTDNTTSPLDLVRKPLLLTTISLFFIWFSLTIIYYGLVFNMNAIGGDLHTINMLSGLVEIPAVAITIPILIKMGRRYPTCFTILVSGLCCIGVAVVEKYFDILWIKLTLILISKFCIGATNGVMPMYTAELYPTLLRNLGVGAMQISAGIALVSLPYLWVMSSPIPMAITGCMGILGGVSVLFLPETSRKSLSSRKANETKSSSSVSENT